MDVFDTTSLVLALGFTAAAVVMDFQRMRISNRMILAGLAVSLLLCILRSELWGIFPYLCNIAFPVIILYLFYLIGVLGAGDVKLFSLIGGFVNFTMLIRCMVYAFLVGALLSLCKLFWHGKAKAQLYAGCVYLLTFLWGSHKRYERNPEDTRNLIHFSFPILIGLILSIIFPCSIRL